MSTEQTLVIESTSVEDTLVIASGIGGKLKGGEVIVLSSDLGGGKTTFVKGMAKGMGSVDTVRSPSFTIGNQYNAGNKTLYHFDFYRLNEPGIMRDELKEVLMDDSAVIVIEWADIVQAVLPPQIVEIRIQSMTESGRTFVIDYDETLQYLFTQKH